MAKKVLRSFKNLLKKGSTMLGDDFFKNIAEELSNFVIKNRSEEISKVVSESLPNYNHTITFNEKSEKFEWIAKAKDEKENAKLNEFGSHTLNKSPDNQILSVKNKLNNPGMA